MKRVLLGIGGVVLLAVLAIGVAVARLQLQERAGERYCDKVMALAAKANDPFTDGGKMCRSKVSHQVNIEKRPASKAKWQCDMECAETHDSWSTEQACERSCGEKVSKQFGML